MIRAARDFVLASGRPSPIYENQLEAIWRYYESARLQSSPTLLHQPAFSDWQDSARRLGIVLHTQLLQLQATHWLEQSSLAISPGRLKSNEIREAISRHFAAFVSGLRPEFPNSQQVSIDSHSLLIRENLLDDASVIWSALKDTSWMTSPGLPIRSECPRSEVSWTTKVVGLRHYHDGLKWGWIIAESATICYSQGDRVRGDQRILELARLENGPFLSEAYDGRGRCEGLLYQSESPFTWTAAKVMEAFTLRSRLINS